MIPYDEATPCKKCGATGATTELTDDLSFLSGGRRTFPLLKRTCQRCGYAWRELPLDAKGPASDFEEKAPEEEGAPRPAPTE